MAMLNNQRVDVFGTVFQIEHVYQVQEIFTADDVSTCGVNPCFPSDKTMGWIQSWLLRLQEWAVLGAGKIASFPISRGFNSKLWGSEKKHIDL